MNLKYHINVFWYEPDACWIADIPDLKYCSAHGPTPETALAEARIAMELWIESCEKHGDPIPEPKYRPAIYALPRAA